MSCTIRQIIARIKILISLLIQWMTNTSLRTYYWQNFFLLYSYKIEFSVLIRPQSWFFKSSYKMIVPLRLWGWRMLFTFFLSCTWLYLETDALMLWYDIKVNFRNNQGFLKKKRKKLVTPTKKNQTPKNVCNFE